MFIKVSFFLILFVGIFWEDFPETLDGEKVWFMTIYYTSQFEVKLENTVSPILQQEPLDVNF